MNLLGILIVNIPIKPRIISQIINIENIIYPLISRSTLLNEIFIHQMPEWARAKVFLDEDDVHD